MELLVSEERRASASPWLRYHLGQSTSYTELSKKLQKRPRQKDSLVDRKLELLRSSSDSNSAHTRSLAFVPAAKVSAGTSPRLTKSRTGSGTNLSYRDYFWLPSTGPGSKSRGASSTPRSASTPQSGNGGGVSSRHSSGQQSSDGSSAKVASSKVRAIRNRLLGTSRSEYEQPKALPRRNQHLDQLYPDNGEVQSEILFLRAGVPEGSTQSGVDHSKQQKRQQHQQQQQYVLNHRATTTPVRDSKDSQQVRYTNPNESGPTKSLGLPVPTPRLTLKQREPTEMKVHLFSSNTLRSQIGHKKGGEDPLFPVTREVSLDSVIGSGRVPPPSPTLSDSESFNLKRHAAIVNSVSWGSQDFSSHQNSREANSGYLEVQIPLINTQQHHRGAGSGTRVMTTQGSSYDPVVIPKHDLYVTSPSNSVSQMSENDYSGMMIGRGDYSVHSESVSSVLTENNNYNSSLEDTTTGNGQGNSDVLLTTSEYSDSETTSVRRSVRFNLEENIHEYEPWEPIDSEEGNDQQH